MSVATKPKCRWCKAGLAKSDIFGVCGKCTERAQPNEESAEFECEDCGDALVLDDDIATCDLCRGKFCVFCVDAGICEECWNDKVDKD